MHSTTTATLVAGDGEGSSSLGIDARVGVLVETVTLADLDLDLIGTSSEVGVALDVPGDVVLANSLSIVDLLVSLSLNITRGLDKDGDETGSSGVDDGVQGLNGEGGSNGSRGGGDGDRGEGHSSAIDLGTGVELLAVPDGIGVSSAWLTVLVGTKCMIGIRKKKKKIKGMREKHARKKEIEKRKVKMHVLVNDVDELLDSDEIAEEITGNVEDLVGDEVA